MILWMKYIVLKYHETELEFGTVNMHMICDLKKGQQKTLTTFDRSTTMIGLGGGI
jgi:hypothetical protein